MNKEILVSVDEFENRVAIMEDGRLVQIYISREERLIGSIYKGKITSVLPGMQAAFVNIGLTRNAFLCIDDANRFLEEEAVTIKKRSIKDLYKVNQETLVQIIKEPLVTKGARVTNYISLPGRYLVLMPGARYTGVSRRIDKEEEKERLKQLVAKLRPRRNLGLIVRTAAEGKNLPELERDLEALLKLWDKIQHTAKHTKAPAIVHQELPLVYKVVRDLFTTEVDRFIIDSLNEYEKVLELLNIFAPDLKTRVFLHKDNIPLFELYGIETEMERGLRKKIWLDSGGSIVIDKGEALTTIDVNTGKFTGGSSLEETILHTNLEAAREITRQIRLRDIGGIIIIDFIDMESEEHRKKLLANLEELLKKDSTKTTLVGITELGLVQITRKRISKDLEDFLREPCPCCGGRGKIFSVETMRIKLEREIRKLSRQSNLGGMLLTLHPRLAIKLLGWEGEELERLENETGKIIYVRVDKDLNQERFEIECLPVEAIEHKICPLVVGEELELKFEDNFGINVQDAMGFYHGNLIEIMQGGKQVGKISKIIITHASRHYGKAQIRD